jgi:hypothetical protein
MKRRKGLPGRALIALGAIAALTAPALTQRPARPAALQKLQAGLWQLRDLDNPRAELPPVCLGDPNLLVQLRHRSAPCSRLVVAQDDLSATVHYTCTSGGYGQTLIRIETPRLAQIETQGIAGNAPFASRLEARRVGTCGQN